MLIPSLLDRRPVVISGPSGVGKGTLYKKLFARYPDTFALSVSHTTRRPRPGERDGNDYHFVNLEAFQNLVSQNGFVEYARFGDNMYGTSKQAIADSSVNGRVVVLDIEVEGVKQVKSSGIDARYVFIAPPSMQELERRLRSRGTESEESIQKRLTRAQLELDFAQSGVHDKVIVNDDLETASTELEVFVFGVGK